MVIYNDEFEAKEIKFKPRLCTVHIALQTYEFKSPVTVSYIITLISSMSCQNTSFFYKPFHFFLRCCFPISFWLLFLYFFKCQIIARISLEYLGRYQKYYSLFMAYIRRCNEEIVTFSVTIMCFCDLMNSTASLCLMFSKFFPLTSMI